MQAMLVAFIAIVAIAFGANYVLNDPKMVKEITTTVDLDLNLDRASNSSVRLD